MRKLFCVIFLFVSLSLRGQKEFRVSLQDGSNQLSPMIYGNFIEFLGSCINGGIYDEKSPLSDERGFRKDVLEKVKEMKVPILRFPGGTVSKIYHWEDGIGPKEKRIARKNLIWGGIEDNHFGTDEFIAYCHQIGAEPCIVVNMATGTAEEASNWVEYCNGTGNTYYANLRRANGFKDPFNVKYWGLGNEESATPDIGRLSDPGKYAEEAILYTKMMKLTDRSIKLIFNGDFGNLDWTKTVLDKVSPFCDYISVHHYIRSAANDPLSLYKRIESLEKLTGKLDSLLDKYPEKITEFNKWYRFPPRQQKIKISLDEWGIWELNCPGVYNLECDYNWHQALATASFLNYLNRNSGTIEIANWAQLVNILGTIKTNASGSAKATVAYPMEYFRKYAGNMNLQVRVDKQCFIDNSVVSSLDVSATMDEKTRKLTVFAVNRDPSSEVKLFLNPGKYRISSVESVRLYSDNENSINFPGKKDIVSIREEKLIKFDSFRLKPSSIYILNCTTE